MDAIDVSFSSKTKYEYLINIVRGILCQNSLLFIHLDIIYQIIKHGFNITFHYEAILKIIACSYRFTTVHRQRFTGMAAVSVWTGTLGDNIQSSGGENLLNVTFLLWILHQSFLTEHVVPVLSNSYSTDNITVNEQINNSSSMIIRKDIKKKKNLKNVLNALVFMHQTPLAQPFLGTCRTSPFLKHTFVC